MTWAVRQVTDPRGEATQFDYDDLHRLTQVTDALGSHNELYA